MGLAEISLPLKGCDSYSMERLKISVKPREFLYISNMLSLSRLLFLPLIILGLTKKTTVYKSLTFAVIVVAMVTDALDGYLARRRNEVSALGKILDPIIDKVCIGSTAIIVVIMRDYPWWAMGFIIFRDVWLVVGGLYVAERWKIINSSNIWGKATLLFQSLSIITYAFELPLKSNALTVAMVFTGVSSISYAMEFHNLRKEKRQDKSYTLPEE